MAKITKERLQRVCDSVNRGERPSYAGFEEGLSGTGIKAMKTAGLIYLDVSNKSKKWKAISTVTTVDFNQWKKTNKRAHAALKVGGQIPKTPKTQVVIDFKEKPKSPGLFKRIWKAIINK